MYGVNLNVLAERREYMRYELLSMNCLDAYINLCSLVVFLVVFCFLAEKPHMCL